MKPLKKEPIAPEYNNGVYRTASAKVSLLSRALPSLGFYVRFLSITFRAGRKAKRGRYDNDDWCRSSLSSLRALEAVGVRIEIEGAENFLNLDGPCVFVANHMSTLETYVLPTLIAPFKPVTFVVKESLVDYPVFGHVMRSVDPVTVGRVNPREDFEAVMKGGTERLQRGISLIIFPQTGQTARAAFNPEEFNTLGIKLARKAEVPIVPVALKTDAWGLGVFLKDFGRIDPSKRVYFCFGKPVRVEGRGTEEHRRIIEFIGGKLGQWEGPVRK